MKQNYQLDIVTPVHIGSGEALNHIDGYYANGRWYYINLERVLAHPSADLNTLTSEMGKRDFRWERHLRQRNIDPAEVSMYSLSCPQSPEEVEIREAIKGIHDQPFIPGSTLFSRFVEGKYLTKIPNFGKIPIRGKDVAFFS